MPDEHRAAEWMANLAKARGRYKDGVEGAMRTIQTAREQDKIRQREIEELEALWSLPDDAA